MRTASVTSEAFLILFDDCLVFREQGHTRPETADYTAKDAMYRVNRLLKFQTVRLPSACTVSRSDKICTAAEKAEKFFADKNEYTLSQILSYFNGTRFLKYRKHNSFDFGAFQIFGFTARHKNEIVISRKKRFNFRIRGADDTLTAVSLYRIADFFAYGNADTTNSRTVSLIINNQCRICIGFSAVIQPPKICVSV